VTDPVPSLVSPTLHPKSAKVVDLVLPLVNPTPPLSTSKVVSPVTSLIDPTPPLKNVKMDDLFPYVDPILPLENKTQVVDLMSLLIDHTLPLASKPNTDHVCLVDI